MSMQDPIADMLTRIRNAQQIGMKVVSMPYSKIKEAITRVLKDEGYVADYQVESGEGKHSQLTIHLKYYGGKAVIASIKRISRPGLRVYKSFNEIPEVIG